MRLLADENCDRRLIDALRAAGHDVVSIREICPGADDESVYEMAITDSRTLITEEGLWSADAGTTSAGTRHSDSDSAIRAQLAYSERAYHHGRI